MLRSLARVGRLAQQQASRQIASSSPAAAARPLRRPDVSAAALKRRAKKTEIPDQESGLGKDQVRGQSAGARHSGFSGAPNTPEAWPAWTATS